MNNRNLSKAYLQLETIYNIKAIEIIKEISDIDSNAALLNKELNENKNKISEINNQILNNKTSNLQLELNATSINLLISLNKANESINVSLNKLKTIKISKQKKLNSFKLKERLAVKKSDKFKLLEKYKINELRNKSIEELYIIKRNNFSL